MLGLEHELLDAAVVGVLGEFQVDLDGHHLPCLGQRLTQLHFGRRCISRGIHQYAHGLFGIVETGGVLRADEDEAVEGLLEVLLDRKSVV